MRIRTLSLLTILALVVAACGGGTSEETTTTADDQATTTLLEETTTTASVEGPEAQLLTYTLEPGSSYQYEVSLDQQIDLKTDGDPVAMGDEGLPGDASVSIVGTTVFTHTIADGPEPGTYEITISGDFSDLEISGTVDGESINEEVPEFAEMEPVERTIVVDESGRPVGDEFDEMGGLFGGEMGGLGGLDSFGDLGGSGFEYSHVGPQFPDEPVTVGDSWTDSFEVPMDIFGTGDAEPITSEIVSTVTDTDTIDGVEVLVIETTSTTSAIEFDLADFLIGFMMAFIPEGEEADVDLNELAEEIRFLFSIDESLDEVTTWFDADAGFARRADYTGGTRLVMDINMPDEETGEMVGIVVDMNVQQDVGYRLIEAAPPSA